MRRRPRRVQFRPVGIRFRVRIGIGDGVGRRFDEWDGFALVRDELGRFVDVRIVVRHGCVWQLLVHLAAKGNGRHQQQFRHDGFDRRVVFRRHDDPISASRRGPSAPAARGTAHTVPKRRPSGRLFLLYN
jgi:hypothetical protein